MTALPALPADTWSPACMADDEYAGWAKMNARITGHSQRAKRPCADCTLGYASEMRAVGRCNGTPGSIEKEPEMEQPENVAPPRSLTPARRVALDVAAPPCASCAHEPVCSLRAALERIADVETTAPALPGGLTLTLTAVVSCDHWLRERTAAPARVLSPEQRGRAAARAPRQISDATRQKMRDSAIAARARKAAGEA